MRAVTAVVLIPTFLVAPVLVSADHVLSDVEPEQLSCVVLSNGWENAMAAAPAAAAAQTDCSPLEAQLKRDTDAMRRQQDSIAKNSRELEEWDKANKEALKNAAIDAGKLALGRIANVLEAKQKALRGLQDRIKTDVFRRMGAKNPEYAANLTKKLQDSVRAYESAKRQVDIGKVLETGLSADSIWSMVNSTINAVAAVQAGSDAVVNAALKDPELSSWFDTDNAASEFFGDFAQLALESAGLGPYADVASFVVDTSYNATQWALSRDRILQNVDLSEQDLRAVNALKAQIERTAGRLKQCRADLQARENQAQQPKAQPPQIQPPQVPTPEPPAAEPSSPGNAGAGSGGGVGAGTVAGLTAAGAGAAAGLYALNEYQKSIQCNQYEIEANGKLDNIATAGNALVACAANPRANCTSRHNALNAAVSSLLSTLGNWCTCLGPSAAAELSATEKAQVRDAFNSLRSLGVNPGTLPACFR